ncbi:conserved hypothetical protein [Pseudomonas sp. 8Z]|uniref:hypothetical protein n=1 Tax=Pseudomonas sp. 8Z TaxID=2653166 RepID=UPI0012F25C18|nr:hypothetical protein [Pseudomonas sp. 8Z]VXC22931.1 conserved hypothetical protein [Pseudomonas sp. 8Z]
MADSKSNAAHLANRAQAIPSSPHEHACPHCEEELLFAMRDKYHDFSLGLSVVLQCLLVAEQNGYVPKLPDEWWTQLRLRYEHAFRT